MPVLGEIERDEEKKKPERDALGNRGTSPPRRRLVLAIPWRNWPFRGVTARRELFQLRPLGLYNDVNNIDSLSKFDHQRYPPVGVEIPMAHGTACRSRALQLERNMTVQYL